MFDGDEMNLHLAQSVQARNELKYIASVQYQIVSVKDSSPIIGCQQDTLTGAYMLTQPDTKIKGSDVANILCNTTSDTKFEIEMDKYYNGHEIFSHIIPAGINSMKKSGDKITFQISNGKLVAGFLDKSQLSFSKNSIIHFIWDKSGPNKTRRFIDDSQRLVLNYLLMRGQSVGFKDGLVSSEIKEKIQQMISNKLLEAKYNITQLENDIDPLSLDIIESNIMGDLNTVQPMVGKLLMDYYNINNFFWAGATSGGKGSAANVAQISGLVGQINITGARPRKNMNGRALPYYHSYDDTPEARGFAVNSYMDGLSGIEFFHNGTASREGLIDTAIKSVTWETPIVVIENNKPLYTPIGKWIDEKLKNNKTSIQNFTDRNLELLETNDIYIPTMDENGKVSWGTVKAVTRHDPGNKFYKITTNGGRQVTVVESKSLLIWNQDKFVETLTPEIKIGDYLPVTKDLIKFLDNENIMDELQDFFTNSNNKCNQEQLDRICYLCSRIGVFCIIKNDMILIPKQFVNNLNFKISEIFISNDIFKTINNVVLDPIKSIEISDSNNVKVYDLTIPETFNFGLANGLQVRDTAQTGYIQRQMVKFVEDLSIAYDRTNRNSRGIMIQYVYGENGINQSTQTEMTLNILGMDDNTVKTKLGLSKEQIDTLVKAKNISKSDLEKYNKEYVEKAISLRDQMRIIQSKAMLNYKLVEDKYMVPVNLFRITQDYSNNEKVKPNEMLNPINIPKAIEEFLNTKETRLMTQVKDSDKHMKQDDRCLKTLLEVSLYEYLSPNKCVFEYGLSEENFNKMMKEIRLSFIKAIISPGEMVGILAGQSVGEPTSQMSVVSNQKIKVITKNRKTQDIKHTTINIGELCDNIIETNPELTFNTGHIDSVETDISSLENEYYIVGVDGNEKTHWNKISHVSRHPVNGNLITVTTKSGRSVTTTLSHSHLIRNNQTVEPIIGAKLVKGMRIPVARYIENSFINDNNLTMEYGLSLGRTLNKVPEFAFTAPNEFKRGLLDGYFERFGKFGDNYTSINNNDDHQFIKDIALLLSYFDIFGEIIDNKTLLISDASEQEIDKINGLEEIITKCNQELNLNVKVEKAINRIKLGKYIEIFTNHPDANKITEELKILNQANNSDVVWDEIVDITTYTPNQSDYVYDFTVPSNQTFMVDNGIIVHNTLNSKHSAGAAKKTSGTTGVPRILEIIHNAKNIKTPQMTIYFKEPYSTDRSALNKIVSHFKHLSIRYLISKLEVYYDIGKNDELGMRLKNDKVDNPFFINNQKADINMMPFVMRITMNVEKMLDKETSLLDIKTKFISHWYKVWSNTKSLTKKEKDIITKISRCGIYSNNPTDKEQIIHVRWSMTSFNNPMITEFARMVLDDITLKGIEGIANMDISQEMRTKVNPETGGLMSDKEYVVTTEGVNMGQMKLVKGIDLEKIKCNEIKTIYKMYGIEATRQVLLNELVYTYTEGGAKINNNHLSLLVDTMCYQGEVISIDRHGMGKLEMDLLARASFERTMDHCINGALFNEKDKMKSVASRIAVGRAIPGGTGSFDLLLDTQKLENSEYTQDEAGGRVTFIPLEEEALITDLF